MKGVIVGDQRPSGGAPERALHQLGHLAHGPREPPQLLGACEPPAGEDGGLQVHQLLRLAVLYRLPKGEV